MSLRGFTGGGIFMVPGDTAALHTAVVQGLDRDFVTDNQPAGLQEASANHMCRPAAALQSCNMPCQVIIAHARTPLQLPFHRRLLLPWHQERCHRQIPPENDLQSPL
jgi:hypothetical protein